MIAALIGLILVSGVSALALLRARPASAAALYNEKLLLVHGFMDNCTTAFMSVQNQGGISPGVNPSTTLNFFTFNTLGWLRSQIKLVGYYNGDAGCDPDADVTGDSGKCDQFMQTPNAPAPYGPNEIGTPNDPIRHLGCRLAWYIWHLNLDQDSPVVILAHSMGGLIVRDALAESGHTNGFPGALDVRQVVTVGTPHGGVRGEYLSLGQDHNKYNDHTPRELWDMDPTSTGSGFMSMLTGDQYQAPRGGFNAAWTLIAGSVPGNLGLGAGTPCLNSPLNGTTLLNCDYESGHHNDPYPDGDGVVQADSALSMKADVKILYGVVSSCNAVLGCPVLYSPGSTVYYSHEANTPPFDVLGSSIRLAPEFLLNDASADHTNAWACWSACNSGADGTDGITDLHVDDSNNPNVSLISRSLTEVLALLPAPPLVTPTPTSTATRVPTCSVTNTTSDIEKANDFDERGNEWHVYADVQRDATTNAPCKMRVVVRIFNPAPDGAWHGTFALMSYKGSDLASDSGRHSGSGTYAAHFVWRGPWFNVSSGTYSVKAIEYNGSSYNALRVRGYIGL